MNITATAQGFDLSTSIDSFVRDELQAALGRFNEGIVSVDVFMKDINGPKGGVDKQVLTRIQLRNRRSIATETPPTTCPCQRCTIVSSPDSSSARRPAIWILSTATRRPQPGH